MKVPDDDYTKPSRYRVKTKDVKPPRRDHPLHRPYERDTNWRNALNDYDPDESHRGPSEEG